jgi:hypothetical protein
MQAMDLTSTTSSGGKNRGPSSAGTLVKAWQAFLEEAFAPLADHLPWGVETTGDRLVIHALSGHQDHIGSEHIAIR